MFPPAGFFQKHSTLPAGYQPDTHTPLPARNSASGPRLIIVNVEWELRPAHAVACVIRELGHRGRPPCTGHPLVVRMVGAALVWTTLLTIETVGQNETTSMEDVMELNAHGPLAGSGGQRSGPAAACWISIVITTTGMNPRQYVLRSAAAMLPSTIALRGVGPGSPATASWKRQAISGDSRRLTFHHTPSLILALPNPFELARKIITGEVENSARQIT